MANPALKEQVFRDARVQQAYVGFAPTSRMTIDGVIIKTGALFAILLAGAFFGWNSVAQTKEPTIPGFFIPVLLVAFGVSMVTVFRPQFSPITAPIYAVLEGLVIGAISAVFNIMYNGIVFQAMGLTFGVFGVMLVLFSTGKLRATPRFTKMVIAATFAICALYIVTLLSRAFGHELPLLNDAGPLGILLSLGIVVVAALNLVIDFEFIGQNAQAGGPKYLEWYSGFALLSTTIWLYLEILRLLAKLRR